MAVDDADKLVANALKKPEIIAVQTSPTPKWVEWLNIGYPFAFSRTFSTVRGAENFHIYLWISKDLGWSQDWRNWALTLGSLAMIWNAVLAYHAFERSSAEEAYQLVGVVLWLFANFLWMYGEVVNDDDAVFRWDANHIFIAALSWYALYHLVLLPLKIIQPDQQTTAKYASIGMVPRFRYFKNWRQYEHAHTMFWLGKDFSWNQGNKELWVFFLIPTLALAIDFIWVCGQTKYMMVDTVHYVSQLMWVMGNLIWAVGELFYPDVDDTAHSMWDCSASNQSLYRWWASWMLFGAYLPILLLYLVWLPLTYAGYLKHSDPNVVLLSHSSSDLVPIYDTAEMPTALADQQRQQQQQPQLRQTAGDGDVELAAMQLDPSAAAAGIADDSSAAAVRSGSAAAAWANTVGNEEEPHERSI